MAVFKACTCAADVNDGGWHMITVSTFPNGTKGYTLFVDGAQVSLI